MKITIRIGVLLISQIILGQTYTGKIVDSQGQPISYANVVIYRTSDKLLLKGEISDDNGNFIINLTTDESAYLEISFIGFITQKIELTQHNLGTIILKEEGETLDEVTLTARKKLIQQKVDRLVFNVENSVASSGGDALDALKVTPGVNVQNSGLSIVGKQEVSVMVNDRIVMLSGEELMSYLSSIASSDIKNIEVITTPPSKYDAEGNSGLINIQLKKSPKNSWNNRVSTSYIQTTYPAVRIGNTFSYNSGKVQLLASVNGKKGNEGQIITSDISYPEGPWIGKLKSKNQQDFVSGRFGFDYTISDNSRIGFLYAGTTSNRDVSDRDNINILNINNVTIGSILSKGENDKKGQNHSLNAHYIQQLDTLGRKFSVDIDYFNFQNSQDRIFTSERFGNQISFFKANNISDQNINNYSAKVDIEHPFSWAKLSYGVKITSTKTKNLIDFFNLTSGVPVFDPLQSDNFEYTENVQAFYFDMAKSFGKKWRAKLGIRLENTQTRGFSKSINKIDKRNYSQLFPTAYISYIKNENNIFNISYSRRIKRPAFWELNPFRWHINSTSFVEGNPFLQPAVSDNFELKYVYKNKLISKVFVQLTNDGFGQIPQVDPTSNLQIYTRKNYYTAKIYGVDETALYNPFPWWNTVLEISVFSVNGIYKKDIDLNTKPINGLNFQFYYDHNFFLNTEKNLQLETTFRYTSPQRIFLYKTTSSFLLDLGAKLFLMNKALQFSLSVNDILKSSATDDFTFTNNIKQVYHTYNDNRFFKMGLIYKFGNQKINVDKYSFGNEQEKQRSRN